ncbi:MAG: colicin V production protein [Desulfobacteraceae bacterium 4572_35.1]|nr:MAG: colicin V production protein [Desulfobacteraceae bacterium 4572_35.1]
MNALDIGILVILALFTVKGALRGLVKEICALIGLITASILTFHFYIPVAGQLETLTPLPPQLCVIIAMIVLFVVTMIIFAVAGAVLSRFVKLLFLGGLNRVIGALFSLLQGTLVLALVLYGLSLASMPAGVKPLFTQSQLRPPFVQLGQAVVKHSSSLLHNVK